VFEDRRFHDAVDGARTLRPRLSAADHVLGGIGDELRAILIIALALAILVAPTAIGLALVWGAWVGTVALTGSRFLGWIAGIVVLVFFARYVWGTRLQWAARRAAAALLAR
jgi:hypothetical protein